MIAKHYANDVEIMANLNKVKWVPQPKGSVAGGVKPDMPCRFRTKRAP